MVIPNPDLELVPEDSSSGSESSSDDDDESESDYSEVDVEADDAHVEVSTLQSWLAMIPLTKYWWEARRADLLAALPSSRSTRQTGPNGQIARV